MEESRSDVKSDMKMNLLLRKVKVVGGKEGWVINYIEKTKEMWSAVVLTQ